MSTHNQAPLIVDTNVGRVGQCPYAPDDSQADGVMHALEEPVNKRPPDHYWETLVEDVESRLVGGLITRRKTVILANLQDRLDEINRQTLDGALYFGVSKALVPLIRELRDPVKAGRVTDKAASTVVEIGNGKDNKAHAIQDLLFANELKGAFASEASKSMRELSIAEQIVLRALIVESVYRQKSSPDDGVSGRSSSAIKMTSQIFSGATYAGGITAGTSTFFGAVVTSLDKYYEGRENDQQLREAIQLMRDPVNDEVLQLPAKKLLLVDAQYRMSEMIHVDEINGSKKVVFEDRSPVKLDPQVLKNDKHNRSTRKVCPAVSVDGSIPLVKSIIVNAVEQGANELGIEK